MLLGGGCSADSCSGGIRNSAEKGISRGANCQVFASAVFKIRRAPRVFLNGFPHFPVVMVRVATLLIYHTKNPQNFSSRVLFPAEQNRIPPEQKLLCGKSSSICKSRAKAHPDGHHFEIIQV
jgi:hypothetical protein